MTDFMKHHAQPIMESSMRRIPSTLFCLALGAVLVLAPDFADLGSGSAYDIAYAKNEGNGKNGGKGNSHGNGASASAANGSTTAETAKQKSKPKQIALGEPSILTDPSALGRWHAAKPMTHPAMLAHIRNGNFTGTIGMLAAYGLAQYNYNELQAQAAAADAAAATLAEELAKTPYATVQDYQTAVDNDLQEPIAVLDEAIAAAENAPVAATTDEMDTALKELATAEANMELYSNRAPWDQIRDEVRARMGLDPAENDLVTETTPTDPPVTP
jgi:hypothetical protein